MKQLRYLISAMPAAVPAAVTAANVVLSARPGRDTAGGGKQLKGPHSCHARVRAHEEPDLDIIHPHEIVAVRRLRLAGLCVWWRVVAIVVVVVAGALPVAFNMVVLIELAD